MWRKRGEIGGFARSGSGGRSTRARQSLQPLVHQEAPASAGSFGILGLLAAVLIVVAFHGLFVGSLWKATHEKWVQLPAAMAITLAHTTLGAMGSVWLSRIMPRILGTQFTDGWLSVTTASFVCTVAASSWLGYQAFELLPNFERVTGINLGYVGLFLIIPAAIYFWQLGRSFSW